MADQQIDELYLDIGIDVDKDIDKQISSLASAINELNSAVANVGNLEKYVKALGKISLKGAGAVGKTSIAQSTGNKLKKADTSDSSIANGAKAQSNTVPLIGRSLEEVREKTRKTTTETEKWSKELKKAKKSGKGIKDIAKETKKAGKEANNSATFFGKFVKSIGRIALYRAIRASLSAIAELAKEGFNNFVQFDDETNKAMSNVKNSVGQLANTLGVTLGQALQTVEPILTMLLDNVTGMLDNINMAMSAVSGKDTYKKAIKQNEDYAKSLEKTKNTLLSFDKFEALSSGEQETSPSEMFEEVPIPEMMGGTADFFTEMLSLIKEILPYIKEIGDKLKPVMDKILPKIKDLIIAVLEAIQPILDVITILLDIFLDPITDAIGSIIDIVISVVEQIKGAFQMISGLLKLLTGDFDGAWEDIKKGFANMVNGIANMFIGMVNFIVDLINTILAPFDYFLEKIGVDITIPHWEANANWQPYADGGEFTKGTRFIAGEAGAEIVYNNRTGGGGGVANIEQIAEAQYRGTLRALADYGASRGEFDIDGVAVMIDEAVAGRVLAKPVGRELSRVGFFNK